MRIVVNDIAASKGGAMTVLQDFYNTVKEIDHENEWIFLLGDKYLEETENIKIITLPEIKSSTLKRLAFDLFTGKKFIEKLSPDVVFSMQNTVTFGLDIPQVIYMHQSIPFQDIKKFSFLKSTERKLAVVQHILGAIIRASIRRADKVIVQSEWIRDAVIEKCRVDKSKVVNILPPMKDISEYIDSSVFDKTSFFYPTANMIYKNNDVIYAASQILDKKEIEHTVTLTLPEAKSRGSVKCVGRLPYEEVLKTYNTSTLIFSSYIETVGFPMFEARAIGSIVLASDCPFSREVLKGYDKAFFFNPFDAEELAELMKKVISGEISKKDISTVSVEIYNSWKAVMNEVVSLSI